MLYHFAWQAQYLRKKSSLFPHQTTTSEPMHVSTQLSPITTRLQTSEPMHACNPALYLCLFLSGPATHTTHSSSVCPLMSNWFKVQCNVLHSVLPITFPTYTTTVFTFPNKSSQSTGPHTNKLRLTFADARGNAQPTLLPLSLKVL